MKSPFKFLDSYTLEDRSIFFGRDQEVAQGSELRAQRRSEWEIGRIGERENVGVTQCSSVV